MDPREAILAVMATAFADGIPEIERRVDAFRVEPIWGEEELPMILLSFEREQKDIRTDAPRDYQHTVTVNVVVYCKGEYGSNRLQLLRIVRAVEDIMREWQFIVAGDVDPDAPDRDYPVVEDIRAADGVTYFLSTDGDMDHLCARLAYEADFYSSGASNGIARAGAPPRNRLAEFRKMVAEWRPHRMPEGARAVDEYDIPYGENNE